MNGLSNRLCMRCPNNVEETCAKRPYFISTIDSNKCVSNTSLGMVMQQGGFEVHVVSMEIKRLYLNDDFSLLFSVGLKKKITGSVEKKQKRQEDL